ncbi:hypothetical protein [Trinickia dinghuensis]|uniref:hypothetical protein n=1 Tax=Trinickia dinghuensis TaxID=2291023 RepID=UPI0011C05A82|nr:hypothetical protein [Trinickia dinghuensis]
MSAPWWASTSSAALNVDEIVSDSMNKMPSLRTQTHDDIVIEKEAPATSRDAQVALWDPVDSAMVRRNRFGVNYLALLHAHGVDGSLCPLGIHGLFCASPFNARHAGAVASLATV